MESWLLQRDFHVHSCWSDGEGTFADIIMACLRKGIRRIAITDHFERGNRFDVSPRWPEYLREFALARERAADLGVTLLLGLETGVAPAGGLTAPPAVLERAGLVIASVHRVPLRAGEVYPGIAPSIYWQRYQEHVMTAIHTPGVSVIGHVEAYLPIDYSNLPITTFDERQEHVRRVAAEYLPLSWYEEVGESAADRGVAIELHGMSGSPRWEVLQVLKKAGAKFSIGSDGHRLIHIGKLDTVARLAEAAALERADFAAFVHDTE